MESIETIVDENYIKKLQDRFKNINFSCIKKSNGMFVSNSINLDTSNDYRIFKETQIKRILRSFPSSLLPRTISDKLVYFSQRENLDDAKIYVPDSIRDLISEPFAVQNIGHASLLIQILGFTILTDPVFGSPSTILYPAQTRSYPSIENFTQIDIILISHNHRDHLDISSLKKVLQLHTKRHWPIPKVFTALGDEDILKQIGFSEVHSVDWYTKIVARKRMNNAEFCVTLLSIPADHRSGRFGYDHHRSSVNGWIIYSKQSKVLFKFSGDTRPLSKDSQEATDAVLWNEMNSNNEVESSNVEIPTVVCLEPSGPNYTRADMNVTHQSTSYSALLKFVEAKNLSKLSGIDVFAILPKFKTIMMHHNKFELGPDRFNEGLFVFKKLLLYLDEDYDLEEEMNRQKMKLDLKLDMIKLREGLPLLLRPILYLLPDTTSLLVRAKDFIIEDIQRISKMNFDKSLIRGVLLDNTLFPKVGQRLNQEKLESFRIDENVLLKYDNKKKT